MDRLTTEEAFQSGLRLFNEGEYWHAHEQWEICWRAVQGMDAEFYQALIQTAAALVKWQQGNLRGLQLNWAKARRRLVRLPPVYRGIDLATLAATMDHLLADPGGASAPVIHRGA
ncbi:DUF309 domain-containing protein [Chloroflexus aggregans]|uniref:DUF309 domain-containing protein n=1 Tax=Chloroflexus aggregans (strain MD-66 / DSM 9485) TaxID=326427 RepID=B8G7Q0_CHLAD|nr:DUF309 domain-containing protein [Chloroflexus aggregans]ACL24079.1 protein of unknown function DUF309 [Chloroflexus aggregans DSM 9485]